MAEYSEIYETAVDRIGQIYRMCSPAEQKLLRDILQEMSIKGYSYTLEKVWLADFKEIPVGIDQFLDDQYFMGPVTRGGTAIYKFWRDMMRDVFNHGNRYNEILLSGATRVGKTSSMVTIMCYMLYRLMLYRDPHSYFQKKEISKFTLAFANLTKDLAYGVAYREYQDTLREVPFFNDHGSFTKSDRNFYYVPEGDKINIVAGSSASNFLGMQIWAAALDEVSFAKSGVKDINIAKKHMKELYDTINARISGTFRLNGEVYGKLIASSSKNQDNDFLSDHIEKQQKSGNEHLYLVDEPQWNILPKSMFSDKVFHFTVGDRYKKGFVIDEVDDDEAHRLEYEKQGYRIVEAPAELRKNFLADYDIALRDIAGISVTGAMGFITQDMVTPCVSQERQNPFFEDIIVLGLQDKDEIYTYFHDEVVPTELKNQQMNIHIDLAETKNRTGISGSCVCGNKVVELEDGKKVALPFIKQVFSVGIEAPRGDRLSYQKVVNFIVWLRQHYYNVGTVSTDQFQSSFLRETLENKNFATKKISLTSSMDPYIGAKNLLADQRVELVRNQQQEDEFIAMQRVGMRIVHPVDEDGGHGDIAEAAVGSFWTLVIDQVSAKPPSKNLASIAANVNLGRGKRSMMSSANTVRSNTPNHKYPVRFPILH